MSASLPSALKATLCLPFYQSLGHSLVKEVKAKVGELKALPRFSLSLETHC